MKGHLTAADVWKAYQSGIAFNNTLDLDSEVETNENFFIGKQWEGVQSNGLPTPVFNFLKRVTLFIVASIASDNLKMQASALSGDGSSDGHYKAMHIINDEFDRLFEHNSVGNLIREFLRNAAVCGDGCTYTYWDSEAQTGQASRGAIRTEVIENTRVFFGNPNDRRVQRQPYIIIERREQLRSVRKRAKELGVGSPDDIIPDGCGRREASSSDNGEGRVTVLMYFYKDDETGTVWCCESVRGIVLSHKDLGLTLYPITWLNWDYRTDNYHGQSLISGLIPNQVFINKLFAMSMISLMTTAYPKIVYDKTRIAKWTNQVGAAIAVNGGDVSNVARIIDPATISPQIAEFIKLAVDYTESFLGATPAALGDVRPDNTSAIIALQKAAATPNEITRQNLYASIEELGRIYIDFMAQYYGTRQVMCAVPGETPKELVKFAALAPDGKIPQDFDFGTLRSLPMAIKLDVGASSYWSEIASMRTLDNLLVQGKIGIEDYLERIPDGYITDRQSLLEKVGRQQAGADITAQTSALI